MSSLPCGRGGECSDCKEVNVCSAEEKDWRKYGFGCAPATTDLLERLTFAPSMSEDYDEIQGFVDMLKSDEEWIWNFPISKKELHEVLMTAIGQLGDPHRTIVELRYPLNGQEPHGTTAIGEQLGMSKQLVNHHLKQACKKMRVLILAEIERRDDGRRI